MFGRGERFHLEVILHCKGCGGRWEIKGVGVEVKKGKRVVCVEGERVD